MITLKKLTVGLSVIVMFGACAPQEAAKAEKLKELDLTTDEAKLGYMIGTNMASQLDASQLFDQIDVDALIAAFKDKAAGKDPRMTHEQMAQTQAAFEQKLRAEQDLSLIHI